MLGEERHKERCLGCRTDLPDPLAGKFIIEHRRAPMLYRNAVPTLRP